MKFKKFYLKEAQSKHHIDLFLFAKKAYLPLSPTMMKRLFGVKRIEALHSTNINQLDGLLKIQGSQKSISTFTVVEGGQGMSSVTRGIETGGGIVTHIEGRLVIKGADDLFTVMDKQGRRWIDLWAVQESNFRFYDELTKKINKIRSELFKKYKVLRRDNMWMPWNENQLLTVDNLPQLHHPSKGMKDIILVPEGVKGKLIKDYFDAVERTLKEPMMRKLFEELAKSKGHTLWGYDEIVLNKIKVKEIAVSWDSFKSYNDPTGANISKLNAEIKDFQNKYKKYKLNVVEDRNDLVPWITKKLSEIKKKNGF